MLKMPLLVALTLSSASAAAQEPPVKGLRCTEGEDFSLTFAASGEATQTIGSTIKNYRWKSEKSFAGIGLLLLHDAEGRMRYQITEGDWNEGDFNWYFKSIAPGGEKTAEGTCEELK